MSNSDFAGLDTNDFTRDDGHKVDLLNSVLLPLPGNPGFDIIYFEHKADGSGYVAVNIECHHHHAGGSPRARGDEHRIYCQISTSCKEY
jgi:hypothetical protein